MLEALKWVTIALAVAVAALLAKSYLRPQRGASRSVQMRRHKRHRARAAHPDRGEDSAGSEEPDTGEE